MLGIEITKTDAVPAARCWLQGFPASDAPTGPAMNGSKGLVAPDVLGGARWVAFDFDRAAVEVGQR